MFNLPKYPLHHKVEGAGSIPTTYEPRLEETENAEVPYKHWGVKNADSEPLVNGQQLEKTSETKSLKEMTAQQTEAQPTSGLKTEELDAHSIATLERKQADLLNQADELIRANSEKKLVNLSCDKLNESLLKGSENVLETLQNMELPKGLKVKITLKSQPDNPISLIPPGDNLKDQKDLPKLMNTAIRILRQHDQTKLGDIDSALTEKKLNAINKELVSTDDIIEGRDTGGTGKGAQVFAKLQEQTKRCEISVNQPDHVEVKHPDAIPVTQLLQLAHPQSSPQQPERSDTNLSTPSSLDQSKGNIPEKETITESPDINPNETVKAHDAVTPDVKADITEAASPGNTLNPDPVLNTDSLPPPPDWLMASDPAEEEKIELPTNTGQTKQTSSVQAAKDLDTSLDDISVRVENREDLTEPKIDTSEHNDPPYSTINECQLNTKAFPVSGSDPDYDTVDESGWTAQSSNISNEHLDLEEDGYQRLPGDEDPIYDTVFDEDPYSLPDLPPELPPRPAHLTRSVSEGQIDQLGVQKRKKPRKLPLAGIVNWAKGVKDKHAVLTGIEKPEIRHQRAQDLMNRCTKPGDTVVLTFRGSHHSAMLVYDDILQKPVYLSFGAGESYKERGGGINELAYDIYAFKDMLAEKNIVKLEGMDNKAILKKWRESIKGKTLNLLTRNCSAIIKKMILTGSEQILGKTKLEHDRHWQMPSNTLNLALEIKSKLGASPAK